MATKKKSPAKKPSVKKASPPQNPPQPTYELRVTRAELEHFRDLFGVLLPPDGQVSVSQFLAAITGRQELEDSLFGKIEVLCDQAGVLTGAAAPDYVVMPISPPPMGVFEARLEDDGENDGPQDAG